VTAVEVQRHSLDVEVLVPFGIVNHEHISKGAVRLTRMTLPHSASKTSAHGDMRKSFVMQDDWYFVCDSHLTRNTRGVWSCAGAYTGGLMMAYGPASPGMPFGDA
jgi:hypothetical protein